MTVAIVGAGRMGLRHAEVVRSLGHEIVGICDQNPGALALAAKQAQIPETLHFASAEDMMRKGSPSCVIVATTAPTHCQMVCLAARSGVRSILCEKPMATSLAQCDRMIEECEANGVDLAVNHQMRFMDIYKVAKSTVEDPSFGGVGSICVSAGNFGIAMNGSHYIEMFRFISGEEPAEVTAWFSAEKLPNPRGPQFEDRAGSMRITTKSGKRFHLDAGSDQGHGFQSTYAGRYGQLTVDEATGDVRLSQRLPEHRNEPTTRYLMPYEVKLWKVTPADAVAPTRAVLSALINRENYPTGRDGRRVVETLVAAHVSNEEGHRPVRLDDPAIDRNRIFPWA